MAIPTVRLRFVEDDGDAESGSVVCEVQHNQKTPKRFSLVSCKDDREGTKIIHACNRVIELGRLRAYSSIQDLVVSRHGLEEEGRIEAHLSKELKEIRRLIGLHEDDEG